MAYTYDLSTNTGKVRLLIPDNSEDDYIFTDEEIESFIAMTTEDDEVILYNATALALESIATNEALVQKVIKILDLSTDGTKVAKELRERAEKLRELANNDVDIDIVDMRDTDDYYGGISYLL